MSARHWATVEALLAGLKSLPCDRAIREIVFHGTWRPRMADWHGEPSLVSMMEFWAETTRKNGWTHPLGAHFVVEPDGGIYQPFSLDESVNSSSDLEVNHTSISFETVGDFDLGNDVLEGAQRHAVYGLIGGLLDRFGLAETALHFHCEYNLQKSCPGTGITGGAGLPLLHQVREDARSALAWAKGRSKG